MNPAGGAMPAATHEALNLQSTINEIVADATVNLYLKGFILFPAGVRIITNNAAGVKKVNGFAIDPQFHNRLISEISAVREKGGEYGN